MALILVGTQEVAVPEREEEVNTHLQVQRGDTLIFSATGTIWAGVWFTGRNGPNGWDNIDHDPKFPLPGSHPFCLLGRLSTGYFFIGESSRIDRSLADGTLFLRTNDDTPGGGNGAFQVFIEVYRDV